MGSGKRFRFPGKRAATKPESMKKDARESEKKEGKIEGEKKLPHTWTYETASFVFSLVP